MSCGRRDPDSGDVCGETYTCSACRARRAADDRVDAIILGLRHLYNLHSCKKMKSEPDEECPVCRMAQDIPGIIS